MRLYGATVLVGLGMIACGGPEPIELEGNFGSTVLSSGAQDIFQAFPNQISGRIVVNYDLLQSASIVIPSQAAPTFAVAQAGDNQFFIAFWHKASAAGREVFPNGFSLDTVGQMIADEVPLDRRGFTVILEFLLPFEIDGTVAHHVVAYGCLQPSSPETRVTKEVLEQLLSEPVPVYAGRSCNRCPPLEMTQVGDMEGFEIVDGAFVDPGGDELIKPLQVCPPPS